LADDNIYKKNQPERQCILPSAVNWLQPSATEINSFKRLLQFPHLLNWMGKELSI